MQPLRVLLDTNIIIALADDEDYQHVHAADAKRLMEQVHGLGCQRVASYGTHLDFQAAEGNRGARRRELLRNHYIVHPEAAAEPAELRRVFPEDLNQQDRADLQVLALHNSGYSDCLVTEDKKMRRRAERTGLENVFSNEQAINWFKTLRKPDLSNATKVEYVHPASVNLDDALFDDLKDNYSAFESWWSKKVVREERVTVIIGQPAEPEALAVFKPEEAEASNYFDHSSLKICTFTTRKSPVRSRRGEMLLRAAVDYARQRQHRHMFVEVLPERERLVSWLENFGFVDTGHESAKGERVLAKDLTPAYLTDTPISDPLIYAKRFGPGALRVEKGFIIPIEPRYNQRLFPDSEDQQSLFENESAGNAIRKAYICRAQANIHPGDVLLFLRTREGTRATAVGVAEDALRSTDPREITRFVGDRTVFSYSEIAESCRNGPTLAIIFRLDRSLTNQWSATALQEQRLLGKSWQSVTKMREEGLPWLQKQLDEWP